ncbi:MAG: hypothetical protein GY737_31595 [Desulfobacteraceae bacterium]|nr:hypothetical protein [Desulfobacteraceae bacterium]
MEREYLPQKLPPNVVQIRLAVEKIVGGLEGLLSETQLQLEFVERIKAVRQATFLRYGPLPQTPIPWPKVQSGSYDFAGVKSQGVKTKVPPLMRTIGDGWEVDQNVTVTPETPAGGQDKKHAKKQ